MTEKELLEAIEDLGFLGDDPEQEPYFPDEEPSVPSIYYDCWHPKVPVGYSELPRDYRTVSFSRARYSREAVEVLFASLVAERGWRVHGFGYWTPTRWFWRVSGGED